MGRASAYKLTQKTEILTNFWGKSVVLSLQEAFSSLEDPRIERHKKHNLLDILILTICAVISGAEDLEAIEHFGKEKG